MKQLHEEVDIPEFLHNSPFFLPEQHEFKAERRAKKKPTLKDVLKSKQFRTLIYVILGIILLLYMKRKAKKVNVWGHLTGPSCYFTEPYEPLYSYENSEIDWSQFAYAQYATDPEYLCNSVMLFETLHRLGSKADRILMYPETFSLEETSGNKNTELLLKAKLQYNVKLVPIQVQHNKLASYYGPNWSDSYTKLLAFNQTQYKRLLVLDSDSTILESMDELFFLPPAPVIMPRAYWLEKPTMASHIMLIQPSSSSFATIQAAIHKSRYGVYDMEIVNHIFGKTCVRIPHRTYALLTGEFRSDQHDRYLDDPTVEWNPDAAIAEAKFVHFSDHPMGKPWLIGKGDMIEYQPRCGWTQGGNLDCRARYIWRNLYDEFAEQRKVSGPHTYNGIWAHDDIRGYAGYE